MFINTLFAFLNDSSLRALTGGMGRTAEKDERKNP